ncbi:efflux RND transporter periplasmic adaptor subunit [Haliangium sp.]|uniref:efflux RND transporter periplasmic adaptor subunit n=1 Tax=Haliangium sp. TaxID=2663208 RepID=UPI003D145C58
MKQLIRAPWAAFLVGVAVLVAAGCHSHEHPHDHESSGHGEHDDHGDHGGHAEEHGHGHGHDHGEGAIGITRFTDRLELFAEHPPAITGQELTFLAHLTVLDGFAALERATVTLVLDGPTRVEATVTEMLRPGIFRPALTAPAPGTYRGSLVVTGPEIEDTIDGFEVTVHPTEDAARAAAAAEPSGGAEPISFLKEQQWQVPFATAFAVEGEVVPSIEVAGEVGTPPSGQAEVGAAITGRVVAPARGLPRPGQVVRRGQLLATIAPAPASPEEGARADLAVVEAEARLQSAQAGVERAERLIADRAISQRALDEARRELGVAEQAVQAARRARAVFSGAAAGRGAGSYRVNAPIAGVVVAVHATEGKAVTSGEPLLHIVNLSELWIRARVPEQRAATIRSDQDAAFALPGVDAWLPLDVTGEDATAAVVDVARVVDPRSRTVDVIYALARPDERLRVGAMVRVAVPVGESWRGVVVPPDAVLEDDGRTVVYVQVEGEAFEERTVRLGPRAGALVGIERGVSAGERVVTRGANIIRLSARAATAPAHGHVH